MSTREREVIEKFQQLDSDAQQRVRELIGSATPATASADAGGFDHAAWFSAVESLRQEIHASRATHSGTLDVVGILRDIRDGEDEEWS